MKRLPFQFFLLVFFAASSLASAEKAESENAHTHLDLSSNKCLQQLADNDPVIVSIAFRDGANGFGQLKELVERSPWGRVTATTKEEIQKQIDTQSPFLIITLTKKQALILDDHRDIIRWTLVQSTNKVCE